MSHVEIKQGVGIAVLSPFHRSPLLLHGVAGDDVAVAEGCSQHGSGARTEPSALSSPAVSSGDG